MGITVPLAGGTAALQSLWRLAFLQVPVVRWFVEWRVENRGGDLETAARFQCAAHALHSLLWVRKSERQQSRITQIAQIKSQITQTVKILTFRVIRDLICAICVILACLRCREQIRPSVYAAHCHATPVSRRITGSSFPRSSITFTAISVPTAATPCAGCPTPQSSGRTPDRHGTPCRYRRYRASSMAHRCPPHDATAW